MEIRNSLIRWFRRAFLRKGTYELEIAYWNEKRRLVVVCNIYKSSQTGDDFLDNVTVCRQRWESRIGSIPSNRVLETIAKAVALDRNLEPVKIEVQTILEETAHDSNLSSKETIALFNSSS